MTWRVTKRSSTAFDCRGASFTFPGDQGEEILYVHLWRRRVDKGHSVIACYGDHHRIVLPGCPTCVQCVSACKRMGKSPKTYLANSTRMARRQRRRSPITSSLRPSTPTSVIYEPDFHQLPSSPKGCKLRSSSKNAAWTECTCAGAAHEHFSLIHCCGGVSSFLSSPRSAMRRGAWKFNTWFR